MVPAVVTMIMVMVMVVVVVAVMVAAQILSELFIGMKGHPGRNGVEDFFDHGDVFDVVVGREE